MTNAAGSRKEPKRFRDLTDNEASLLDPLERTYDTVEIYCLHCLQGFRAHATRIGSQVKCESCGKLFEAKTTETGMQKLAVYYWSKIASRIWWLTLTLCITAIIIGFLLVAFVDRLRFEVIDVLRAMRRF